MQSPLLQAMPTIRSLLSIQRSWTTFFSNLHSTSFFSRSISKSTVVIIPNISKQHHAVRAPMKAFGRKRKHSKSGLAWTRKEILPQTGGDAENQERSSTDYSRNFSVSEQMQLCSRSSWTSFVSLWKSANNSNSTLRFFARHCNRHNFVIPMFPTLVG